jgi:hypothetical protein
METIVRVICAHGWTITFVPHNTPSHADYATRTITIGINTSIDLNFLLMHELNHIIAAQAQLSIVSTHQEEQQ